jgi:hypothetical protein
MAYVAIELMTGKLNGQQGKVHLLAPRHHEERRRTLRRSLERDVLYPIPAPENWPDSRAR